MGRLNITYNRQHITEKGDNLELYMKHYNVKQFSVLDINLNHPKSKEILII